MAARPNPWTDDEIKTLRRCWAGGLSASEIALQFRGAHTRSSVISKARQLGLASRKADCDHGKAERIRCRKSGVPSRVAPQAPPAPLGLHPSGAEPPAMERVPFLDLKPGQCKWPLWRDGDTHRDCCGNKIVGPGPYCEDHARRAYTPRSARPGTGFQFARRSLP